MSKSVTHLQSKWDGLSPHLIATFYPCDRDGYSATDGVVVHAPLVDCNLDLSIGWQSPFENVGNSTMPTLQQLLSSGVASTIAEKVGAKDTAKLLKDFEGRSSITKLNALQTFSSMPPVKFSATLILRAWSDPVSEVEKILDQLMLWALPVELSTDVSTVVRGLEDVKEGNINVSTVFPSSTPTTIAMTYKGRNYAPLVIESVGVPLSSPVDSNGNFVSLKLPITLCSLSAWDRSDWNTSNFKQYK